MDYSHLHSHDHAVGTGFLALLILLVAILGLYLLGVLRERRSIERWNWLRTTSFSAGILLLVAAISPPVAAFAHVDLRGHMVQHLMLGMFAPLALVLGAPGTLLLRNVPVTVARSVVALLDTLPLRVLANPVTALLLDMGGMYVLYLTPLYALSTEQPTIHFLVHLHFVLSGYLFTWAIAGPDPAPRRPGMRLRLAVLFIGTAVHATLGKLMYAYGYPLGTGHDEDEIQAAAQLMYYGGDVAELLLAVAFFSIWFRPPRRHRPTTGGLLEAPLPRPT